MKVLLLHFMCALPTPVSQPDTCSVQRWRQLVAIPVGMSPLMTAFFIAI